MPDVFLQLGIVLGVAVTVSFIMRRLKQPLLLGYIIAGLIISLGLSEWIDFIEISGVIIHCMQHLNTVH